MMLDREPARDHPLRRPEPAALAGCAHHADLADRALLEPDFSPDPDFGDLLFNGISQQAYKRDVAYGLQSDGAYRLNDAHTAARRGVRADRPAHQQHHLAGAADRLRTATRPATCRSGIVDDTEQYPVDRERLPAGRVAHRCRVLVVNYGVRFDHYAAFSSGSQLSPRVNFVWQAADNTTVHAGYSRFFSPPPFELVGSTTIDKFLNTTAQPAGPAGRRGESRALELLRPGRAADASPRPSPSASTATTSRRPTSSTRGSSVRPSSSRPSTTATARSTAWSSPATTRRGHFQAYGNLAFQRAIGKDIVSEPVQLLPR